MTRDELRAELDQRGLSIRRGADVLQVRWETVRDYLSGRRRINDDRADLIRMRLAEYDKKGAGGNTDP